MKTGFAAALVVMLASGAAQARFSENSPVTCGDGVDNDDNGLADCDDPKCFGVGVCGALRADDKPATPTGQIAGGIVMIFAGVGVGGASAALFTDAGNQNRSDKRILDYTIGGIMAAAGAALAIGGAIVLKRGVRLYDEEKEMGLAFDARGLVYRF